MHSSTLLLQALHRKSHAILNLNIIFLTLALGDSSVEVGCDAIACPSHRILFSVAVGGAFVAFCSWATTTITCIRTSQAILIPIYTRIFVVEVRQAFAVLISVQTNAITIHVHTRQIQILNRFYQKLPKNCIIQLYIITLSPNQSKLNSRPPVRMPCTWRIYSSLYHLCLDMKPSLVGSYWVEIH